MATHVPDSGPLADYFRDELDSDQPSTIDSLSGGLYQKTARTSPAAMAPSMAPGFHSSIDWRRESDNALPGVYPAAQSMDDTFAEQFKYLICSSGLLERDYVSGLSDDAVSEDERGHRAVWLEKAMERWDLVLAGVCLLLGLAVGVDIWVFGGLVVVGGAVIGGIIFRQRRNGSLPSFLSTTTKATPRAQAMSSLKVFLSQSHSLNSTLSASLDILRSDPEFAHQDLRLGLHRLTDNMADHIATATSTLLEMTDRRELAVLGEMYDIPLAGNSSSSRSWQQGMSFLNDEEAFRSHPSIPLPRRTGLRPLSISSNSPILKSRRQHGSFRSLQNDMDSDYPNRHQQLSIMSLPDPNDRFTQLPERTPRTTKRASFDQSRARNSWAGASSTVEMKWENRIAEDGEDADRSTDSSGEGDKTAVQSLHKRRESISPDSYTSPELDRGSSPINPSTPMTKLRPASSPFRHVPSPLSRRLSQVSENGMIPLRTAPLATHTGGTSLLPSPFETDFSSAPLRPSTTSFRRSFGSEIEDSDPGRKRRSLQNMPYFTGSDDTRDRNFTEGGLTRTRSMPISDLQTLRSARSIGSRSRRSSMNPVFASTGLGIGLPNTFPPDKRSSIISMPSPTSRAPLRRVNSVSPLTTIALTASSLGIHLKRRRMACCLLGLRFSASEDGYWEDIVSTLDDLCRRVSEERIRVEDLVRQVRREGAIKETLDDLLGNHTGMSEVEISPFEARSSFPFLIGQLQHQQQIDFAPRTSDEMLLAEHVDKMSDSIIRAWGDLTAIRAGLVSLGDTKDRAERWGNVRERLGEVVREWERGKEVVVRLDGTSPLSDFESHDGQEEPTNLDKLPEFIRAWDDRSTSRSTSLETDRQSFDDKIHLAEHPFDSPHPEGPSLLDYLPPPGKDTIFESLSAPLPKANSLLSGMSRKERIKLAREAREKGVSVEALLDGGMGGDTVKVEDVRKKGGEVVSELEGVIDVIRRMKEPEMEEAEEKVGEPAEQLEAKDSRRQSSPPLTSPTPTSPSIPISDRQPSFEDSHLQFDLGELKRSFRFPAQWEEDDHVLG